VFEEPEAGRLGFGSRVGHDVSLIARHNPLLADSSSA
jgi:hypothetical protein